MKYLKIFLKENIGKVIFTLILLIGQSVGTLLIPFLVADIIDRGILLGDTQAIWDIGIWMLVVSFVAAAISVYGSWYSAELAALFGHDMRNQLFAKSQQLSIRQLDSIGTASMINRTTGDISHLQANIGLFWQLVVPAPLVAVASIAMTLNASIYLTLVLLIAVLIFVLCIWVILYRSHKLAQKIQQLMDNASRILRESVTGTRVIRAFGNEDYEQQRTSESFGNYANNMIALNKIFALLNPAAWLVVGLCIAAVVWLGGILSAHNQMQIGQITAVAEYVVITLAYLIVAATTITTLPKMISCLNRLQEVLDMQPDIVESEQLPINPLSHKLSHLTFEQVYFSYPEAEEHVLHDISFSCPAGSTTAIIGGTGSGKSTISNLLMRFYDVQSGRICFDNTDIRSLSQQQVRSSIGLVPQKSFLFSGSIADNLRMGSPSASYDDMWQVLNIAQAAEFVRALPLALDAPVAQGGINFSGGQKQRLAIARALIKDSSVYIFDDSLSALDVKTDLALRQALQSYRTDAIKIIVTQRVSTSMNADKILVLDEGRLVAQGSHSELLQTCTVYQEIVRSQIEQKEGTGDEYGASYN